MQRGKEGRAAEVHARLTFPHAGGQDLCETIKARSCICQYSSACSDGTGDGALTQAESDYPVLMYCLVTDDAWGLLPARDSLFMLSQLLIHCAQQDHHGICYRQHYILTTFTACDVMTVVMVK